MSLAQEIYTKAYVEHNSGTINVQENKKKLFSEILNLKSFQNRIVPKFTSSLLHQLQQNKLLFFFSEDGFDKDLFLRYLASEISTQQTIPSMEWVNDSEQVSIIGTLNKHTKKSVIILDDLHPKDLNFNFQKLEEIALREGLYLLISTSYNEAIWNLPRRLSNFWTTLPSPVDYALDDLKKELKKNLEENYDVILPKCTTGTADHFKEDRHLTTIAYKLKTPEQIYLFIHRLSSTSTSEITHAVITQAVDDALQLKDDIIIQSFNALNDFEKFIVLGLTIFDGFYDDQFFVAMSILSQHKWVLREERLNSLDYCDLEAVSNFYNFIELGQGKRLIKSKFSKLRPILIENNWNSLRRHLLSSLPIISTIVINSIDNPSSNWELYGSRAKRQKLRAKLSETISDFGVHDLFSVQNTLIELASHQDITIQRVAAKAMARWIQFGMEKDLFQLLENWESDSSISNLVRRILSDRGRPEEDVSGPTKYLRATIVLTLGFATEQYEPNHLPNEIINLIRRFLNDKNKLVRNRLEAIIPNIIRHHASQIFESDLLGKILLNHYLIFPTGKGLAFYHYDAPEQSVSLNKRILLKYPQQQRQPQEQSLENNRGCLGWLLGAKAISFTEEPDRINKRESIIIAIIAACQKVIELEGKDTIFASKTAIETLFELRQTEKNKTVKKLLFNVLMELLDENIPEIAENLIANLNEGEKELMLESLGLRYLRERKSMANGDNLLEVNSISYNIWVDSLRPETYIEKLLNEWLINGNKIQRQLALETKVFFAKIFDTKEREYIAYLLDTREKQIEEEENRKRKEESEKVPEEIFAKIRAKLKYKFNKSSALSGLPKETKKILNDLVPIFEKEDISEEHLETILQNLNLNDDTPEGLTKGLGNLLYNFKS